MTADSLSLDPKTTRQGSLILVTGGAGYVGSHCVVEMLEAGYRILVIDNFSNCIKGPSNIPVSLVRIQEITGKHVDFMEADLRDKESLRKVFTQVKSQGDVISCVMHFAALKAVGESCSQPLKYYTNNVAGSGNLLEVMHEFQVTRLVFSSSATVYGEPQRLPIDESHPTGNCVNPYGKTKYFMEEIMKDMCLASPQWSCTLLRYFNPVGAHASARIGEDPLEEPNNLMPYVAQVAMGRRNLLSVFGDDWDTEDGTGCRDYIHVTDLAMGHLAALQQILAPGDNAKRCRVYNLGTGRGTTVLQLIKAFEAASGRKVPYRVVSRRAGDVATCFASASLAEKELGWKAERTVQMCCKSEYEWQTNNPTGYRGQNIPSKL